MAQVPGRFNVIDLGGGATLIADFGHNPSALDALCASLDGFPHRLRSAVFSADGDRPDGSNLRQSQLVGDAFDRVFVYDEPSRRRGRSAGEVPALVRRGLALGARVAEVVGADRELGAIGAALGAVRPGELLVAFLDAVEPALDRIRGHLARRRDDARP
jgi:cyanophycin synthetase